MTRIAGLHLVALLTLLAVAPPAAAQTSAADITALRDSIARRYDILPLSNGVALRPKAASPRVRSIEITRGPVALDGQPATGAELRDKLGDDADVILRLSYLTDAERRVFLGDAAPAPRAAVTEPSRADDPPSRLERRLEARRDRRGSDDRVHIGGGVSVRAGEVVEGNVVAVGGGADVDGEVHGDVVAIGGGVRLGPNASVSNNVVVVGGTLQRDPAARVDGQVQEIGLGAFDLGNIRWSSSPMRSYWGPRFGSSFALVATLTRLAILCLLAALVVLLGRGYTERIGEVATASPVKAGAIGLLSQLLFLPVLIITIVVLCITIIGIPLLALIPFVLLGLLVLYLVGFTAAAQRVGTFIAERVGWPRDSFYLTTTIGIVVLLAPALLARLVSLIGGGILFPISLALTIAGACVEYLAWTVGFGAVALLRFERGRVHVSPDSSGMAPAGEISVS